VIEIKLRQETNPEWFAIVENDFDAFLQDHAACERKASATGISMVCKFPDRLKLIEPMIHLAREELLHFHQVCRILIKRGLSLISDNKDPYIQSMFQKVRHGRNESLIDRLLVFGVAEARGTERFGIVAQNIQDPELKDFYTKLTAAEERHHQLFIQVAKEFFTDDEINHRLDMFLDHEAKTIRELPLRPTVH